MNAPVCARSALAVSRFPKRTAAIRCATCWRRRRSCCRTPRSPGWRMPRALDEQVSDLPALLETIPLEQVRRRQRSGMEAFAQVRGQRRPGDLAKATMEREHAHRHIGRASVDARWDRRSEGRRPGRLFRRRSFAAYREDTQRCCGRPLSRAFMSVFLTWINRLAPRR